jgi:hypothetical protein
MSIRSGRRGHFGRRMIHRMNMAYFTGNPPYSIPPYSGGIGGVCRESCDSQRAGTHDSGGQLTYRRTLTVRRRHGLLSR